MDSKKIIILSVIAVILFLGYWFGFRDEDTIVIDEKDSDTSNSIPTPSSNCIPKQVGEEPWSDEVDYTTLQWSDIGYPSFDYSIPNSFGLGYLRGINVKANRRTMLKYGPQILEYMESPTATEWYELKTGEFLCK